MMRWMVLGGLLCVAIAACSQSSATDGARSSGPRSARVHVEPVVINLGRLDSKPGASKEGEFQLANRGTAPLKVAEFGTSCGCTVPDIPPAEIRPGGQSRIKVRVSPRSKPGEHSSSVTVRTNDPASPVLEVLVKWTEQMVISTEPLEIDFGSLTPNSQAEQTIRVVTTIDINISKIILSCIHSNISFVLGEPSPLTAADNEPEQRVRALRVGLRTGVERGPQTTELQLASEDGQYVARLPIHWRTAAPVEVSPEAIFQTGLRASENVRIRLLVKTIDTNPVVVKSVEVDGKPQEFSQDFPNDAKPAHSIVTFGIQAGDRTGIEEHVVSLSVGTDASNKIDVPMTLVIQ